MHVCAFVCASVCAWIIVCGSWDKFSGCGLRAAGFSTRHPRTEDDVEAEDYCARHTVAVVKVCGGAEYHHAEPEEHQDHHARKEAGAQEGEVDL